MGQNTRIYEKFQGYSTGDCSCDYCLYKTKAGCSLAVCCCVAEKAEALLREVAAENQLAVASARGLVVNAPHLLLAPASEGEVQCRGLKKNR